MTDLLASPIYATGLHRHLVRWIYLVLSALQWLHKRYFDLLIAGALFLVHCYLLPGLQNPNSLRLQRFQFPFPCSSVRAGTTHLQP